MAIAAMTEMCHCGKPLHYNSPAVKLKIEEIIADKGEHILVRAHGRMWRVSRHYIALHGLKAEEVASLGFEEVH